MIQDCAIRNNLEFLTSKQPHTHTTIPFSPFLCTAFGTNMSLGRLTAFIASFKEFQEEYLSCPLESTWKSLSRHRRQDRCAPDPPDHPGHSATLGLGYSPFPFHELRHFMSLRWCLLLSHQIFTFCGSWIINRLIYIIRICFLFEIFFMGWGIQVCPELTI